MMLRTAAMLILTTAVSLASIHPRFYRQVQDRAAEHVAIQLLKVGKTEQNGNVEVRAQARVVRVIRSASSLRPGQTIAIHYTTRRSDPNERAVSCATPPLPVLETGQSTSAFLHQRKGETNYRPAAGHVSFQNLID